MSGRKYPRWEDPSPWDQGFLSTFSDAYFDHYLQRHEDLDSGTVYLLMDVKKAIRCGSCFELPSGTVAIRTLILSRELDEDALCGVVMDLRTQSHTVGQGIRYLKELHRDWHRAIRTEYEPSPVEG